MPGREAALAWASLAQRSPASSVPAREGAGCGSVGENPHGRRSSRKPLRRPRPRELRAFFSCMARAAPGKSGLHARGEGERVLALESREPGESGLVSRGSQGSNEYSGLISFRMDWLDLLAIQGTLKSLLQHHSSKASILRRSV